MNTKQPVANTSVEILLLYRTTAQDGCMKKKKKKKVSLIKNNQDA